MKICISMTFKQAQLSRRGTASARFSAKPKDYVAAAQSRHRYWELI
ncbi:hypothetical protein [Nostoc sp.]